MAGLKVRDLRGPHVGTSYIGAISPIGILNVNQGVLATSVMAEVGGFDEEFRDYGIDPDLTARVLFAGYDIVFTRDIALHHYRNWNSDEESAEAKDLRQKHERAHFIYNKIYGAKGQRTKSSTAPSAFWRLAKAVVGNTLGVSLNSRQVILGSLPRDYYNALYARYINPLDPILSCGLEWHLRQRCRRRSK